MGHIRFAGSIRACLLLSALLLARPEAVLARDDAQFPAAPLAQSLRRLTDRFGVSVGADTALPAIMTRAVDHPRNAADALARMLEGSGWIARRIGPDLWRIVPTPHLQAPRAPAPRAQPLPPAPQLALQDIVVTATKTQARLTMVPRALSVVQLGADQQTFPVSGSEAVARASDGLVLTALGPGSNRMFLRAVADSPLNGSSQSPVAVLVDGRRLTYAAPDPDLRLVDVERVELLKGPQGSLYGTGALGGIYQIVPAAARADRIEAMVSAGGTVSVHGAAGPAGAAMINLPVLPGRAALRLVGYGERDPGWITTGTRANANRSTVSGGRADLGIDAAADWRIDLTGLAQRIRSQDSQYVYAPGSLSRPDQAAEPHLTEIANAALRIRGALGAARIDLVSGYTWHHVRSTLDASVGGAALANALGADSAGLFTDDRQFRVWESEARVSGHWRGVRWMVGAVHTEARETALRDLTASTTGGGGSGGGSGGGTLGDNAEIDAIVLQPADSGSSDIAFDLSRRNAIDTAVFGALTVPLGRTIEVEGGARYYASVLDVARVVEEASGQQRIARHGVTPSGAVVWRPDADAQVYVRYGEAFRQGGLAFGEETRVTAFAADRLASLEAGWRQTAGVLSLDASLYLTWWNDMQADTLLSTGLIETRNVGRALIKGGELGLTLRPGESWRISLGATVQHARLVDPVPGAAMPDARLPMIPDYALRGSVERGFALAGGQATLRASLRWLGPARLSFDPRLDVPTGNVLESTIAGSLRFGRLCLALLVDNPLNRAGNSFAYGNPFRVGTPQYTPQAPLRATGMATVRF